MDAVVFDWDGTLVDSLPAITRANAVVMRSYGIDFDADLYREAYSPDWQVMYERLGIPASEVGEAGRRWLVAYRDVVGDLAVMPGAAAALEALAAAGL
ncbi:MAG: HAD family hydrolase, partial [Candidatus Limnocylindrales bacterium]